MITQQNIARHQIPGNILKCVKCLYFLSSFQKNFLQIDFAFIVKWKCPCCQYINAQRLITQNHKQLSCQVDSPKINFINKQYFQQYRNYGKKIVILDCQLLQEFLLKKDQQTQNVAYSVQSCWKELNKQKQLKKSPSKMRYPVNELKKHSAILFKYDDLKGALLRRKNRKIQNFNWQNFQQRRQVSHCELILWFIDQVLFDICLQNCEILICNFKKEDSGPLQKQSATLISIEKFLIGVAKKDLKNKESCSFGEALSLVSNKICKRQAAEQRNNILIFCSNQAVAYIQTTIKAQNKLTKLIYLSNSEVILAGYSKKLFDDLLINPVKKATNVQIIHQLYQNLSIQSIQGFLSQNRIEGRIYQFIDRKQSVNWDTRNFDNIQFHHIHNRIKQKLYLNVQTKQTVSPFAKDTTNKIMYYSGSCVPSIYQHWNMVPHKIYAVFQLKSTGKMVQWFFFNQVKQNKMNKNPFSNQESDSQSDKQFVDYSPIKQSLCLISQFNKSSSDSDEIQYI